MYLKKVIKKRIIFVLVHLHILPLSHSIWFIIGISTSVFLHRIIVLKRIAQEKSQSSFHTM
jgi:hypothetical protein